ncbi:hypothetical protein DPEC_G00299390 [Dallia pectoralis]|uniref:Uncharacterized protein n=1 Tax=Dallia pectoralis TaxID=75939 RepID=A0ACC2FGG9_DALPE|nr:hypothetical protein DPEC_G00299390 [Dallia pectoralis]
MGLDQCHRQTTPVGARGVRDGFRAHSTPGTTATRPRPFVERTFAPADSTTSFYGRHANSLSARIGCTVVGQLTAPLRTVRARGGGVRVAAGAPIRRGEIETRKLGRPLFVTRGRHLSTSRRNNGTTVSRYLVRAR